MNRFIALSWLAGLVALSAQFSWATDRPSPTQLEGLGSPSRVIERDQGTLSPNNRYLAFTRRMQWDRAKEGATFTLTEVWVRDQPVGTNRLLLDRKKLSPRWSDPVGEGFSFARLLWSPNSEWLALSDASHFFRGVVVVQIANGRVFELEGNTPAWSPDSSMLALCKGTELGVNSGILILKTNSGKIAEHLLDMPVYPELFWRGRRLIFETVTDHGDEFFSYDPGGGYGTLRRVRGPTKSSP